MLPRQHRVRSSSDFKRIMRSGRRIGSPAMTVYVHTNELEIARFGFVVSKSVGNAVHRNLVKRRLRAAAAQNLAVASSNDVVVRATAALVNESFASLEQQLAKALSESSPK